MAETIAEYHRRRAAEEKAEADRHPDDITADQHRRLARQHLALARNAKDSFPAGQSKGESPTATDAAS